MSGKAATVRRVRTRSKKKAFIDAVTVPYPPNHRMWDEGTTVVVDPSEMRLTAEAMMWLPDEGVPIERPVLPAVNVRRRAS
jgi:hypothetical protein